MFKLFNPTNVTRLAKSAGYLTALSGLSYWSASEEMRRREEMKKANPTCDVISKFVPVSSGVGYFELVLVPKKMKMEEQLPKMHR